ncbi:MAG: kelch repeat-containing protein [Steroidobacterales bacterium]|jgi:N-acetylneuraminic acid mutarotase
MQTICLVAVALALADCGGSSSTSISTTTSIVETTNYTVGGTISGLTVSSVVLANGTATVTIAADASSWVFPTSFAPGSSYSVTVQTQPVGERCEVTSGASGMDTGDVGNVTVVCGFGQWTWEGGSKTVNAAGVYGTQGTAAASNLPGARYSGSSWTDSSGNFWLFGGVGYDLAGGAGYLNDLWQYSPSTGQWTWEGGLNTLNASGVYGTQGATAASNLPGARYSASSWTDSSGNFWLFGGVGYSSTGSVGNLNDLWRYSPSTGQWTWVSGGTANNAAGVYGTQGTAAASNLPGARYSASSWTDSSGNFWLFGGVGYGSTGSVGNLNDLWRYSPTTGQWTWVSGGTANNAAGVYGTQGTAAASNLPGARYSASAWIDSSGNLWLFGGYGYDSTGSVGKLNDLWQYSPSTGQWTWVSGEDAANATGVYGALGTAAASNLPGARQAASAWINSSGNFWLFGGVGYDSAGGAGNLNDLWQYSPSTKEWTWFSGGNADNATGVYGTQGAASVGNVLGGRDSVSSWTDSSGNLWLFGGYGYDSTGDLGYLNDLWQYNPSTGS